MPLPEGISIPGWRADGSPKFHADVTCTGLRSLKGDPVRAELPLERFSKSATCQACCDTLRDVGNSYRRYRSEGLPESYPDPEGLVLLETGQVFLPLPPVLGPLLEVIPEHQVLHSSAAGRNGFRNPSLRRVPAWLGHWLLLYSRGAGLTFDQSRFRVHLAPELVVSEEHVALAARIWQAAMWCDDRLQYSQYLVPAVRPLFAVHGLDRLSAASQLWLESAESEGPLRSLGDALVALDLLLS